MDLDYLLARFWGMGAAQVTPLGGGMNSETWLVAHGGLRYVAKSAALTDVADLVSGAEVAMRLAEEGFVTGRPVPTRDGKLLLIEPPLVLLEYVRGRELDGRTDEEQEWIASTLANVHCAGTPGGGPSVSTFAVDWVCRQMPGVDSHPWLGAAVEAVRAETDALSLTWSVLHTDPLPGAFIHDDDTGVTGLIDWAGARRGPVLYDVASAVMYLGGPARASTFLSVYTSRGPLAVQGPGKVAFQQVRSGLVAGRGGRDVGWRRRCWSIR